MVDDDELVPRRLVPDLIEQWFGRRIAAKTLANWKARGEGPPVRRVRHLRDAFYSKRELRAYFLQDRAPRR